MKIPVAAARRIDADKATVDGQSGWGSPVRGSIGEYESAPRGSLGDHAWVGINSVVLDGAFVADDCLLGSISCLLEGVRTTERTLWTGSPAVELENRTEAQIAGHRERATTRSSMMATLQPVDRDQVVYEGE
jgi:acetyltransferase-like isoleucine patch superfamily enzyme